MAKSELDENSHVSARLSLLDVQVLDAEDLPVGRVDDLELESEGDEVKVAAVLTGQRHLGPRIGGVTGHTLTWSARQLSNSDKEGRIEVEEVATWRGMLKLRSTLAELPIAGLEKFLAVSLVRHIPGADDAGL